MMSVSLYLREGEAAGQAYYHPSVSGVNERTQQRDRLELERRSALTVTSLGVVCVRVRD